jgi:hypothetical protein
MYAAAKISDYWIVNLRERCIEVLRSPDADARQYRRVAILQPDDRIDVLAVAGASIAVSEILPPR